MNRKFERLHLHVIEHDPTNYCYFYNYTILNDLIFGTWYSSVYDQYNHIRGGSTKVNYLSPNIERIVIKVNMGIIGSWLLSIFLFISTVPNSEQSSFTFFFWNHSSWNNIQLYKCSAEPNMQSNCLVLYIKFYINKI